MTIRSLLATFAVLCITRAAPAQQSPRFSGSLLLGAERTGGGDFRDNAGVASEIAGTARLAVIRDVAFMATVAYGGVGGTGAVTSICILSPRGGCRPAGANLSGLSLRVGIERRLGAHLALGASVGGGWYANHDGDDPAGARVLPFAVGVLIPIVSHVTISGLVERIEFRDFGGVNFHSNAFLVGLRCQ
jgi:hypothetical protein